MIPNAHEDPFPVLERLLLSKSHSVASDFEVCLNRASVCVARALESHRVGTFVEVHIRELLDPKRPGLPSASLQVPGTIGKTLPSGRFARQTLFQLVDTDFRWISGRKLLICRPWLTTLHDLTPNFPDS